MGFLMQSASVDIHHPPEPREENPGGAAQMSTRLFCRSLPVLPAAQQGD